MSNSNDLISLIKSQVNKAQNLFTEKNIVETELKEVFNAIKHTMSDEIIFIFENEIDRYGDTVCTIYASNPNIKTKYTVITYDFDNKSIFPVKITNVDDLAWLCNNLEEVHAALAKMISDDNFMIRLVAIAKEKESTDFELDDDIPF